jgi:quinol monooxygenase YgiN
MINVIAAVRVKSGRRSDFLAVFKRNVPAVRAETGCIEYMPAVDADAGLPMQRKDPDLVTVIEKWDSVEALHKHLAAPHMLEYRKQVKDLVESISVQVLREA